MKTLVVGAHGVIGWGVARRLVEDGHDVTTVGRRGPVELLDGSTVTDHVQVDLSDRARTISAFEGRDDITHVVYTAYVEKATMAAAVAPNVAMLRNALDALESAAARLEHVVLVGGGKSYGQHLGGYKTPAKESDPRFLGPIFYNDQEDVLAESAARVGFTWTVLRPDAVLGVSIGSPMNMITGLAVYAEVCKRLGVPLRFPGTPAAWTALHQATDANVIAGAASWAPQAAKAHGEIFNVTNGDLFRWEHVWPEIADFFGLDTASPQPMALQEQMKDKDPVWDAIVKDNGLRNLPMGAVAAWPFVDGWFSTEEDMVQSTIKIRKAGFHECADTHESFRNNFTLLRQLSIVP